MMITGMKPSFSMPLRPVAQKPQFSGLQPRFGTLSESQLTPTQNAFAKLVREILAPFGEK
jgi:hypothetical protein